MKSQKEMLVDLLFNIDPLHERDLDDYLVASEVEAIADYLLANGVVVLPPGVRPVVRAVTEQICNQFLVTKETRIQWSEQAALCSEEEALRIAHEFINDWDAKWNRRQADEPWSKENPHVIAHPVVHQPTKAVDSDPPNCGSSVQNLTEGDRVEKFFTPEQVRAMSKEEVRKNYGAILQSMNKW